ncbi:MAG: hypothetical protein ACLP5H_10050 [Desulfomonilaceae bacterium]
MAKIGNVKLQDDLHRIPKNEDNVVMGSDTRTLDGSIVSLQPVIRGPIDQFRTYAFQWATRADVDLMNAYAVNGSFFELAPEEGGPTYQVIFAAQGSVVAKRYKREEAHRHSNGETDELYCGEIRVISKWVPKPS